MPHTPPRVAVVQDSARLHYALPLALQRQGLLETVFSPWYTAPGSLEAGLGRGLALLAPRLGRRIAGRQHPELDPRRVRRSLRLVLREAWAKRRCESLIAYYDRCTELETHWILSHGWGRANALCGFVRNLHPRLCEAARGEGLTVVADQMIAPAVIERAEHERQQQRFPGWETGACLVPPEDVEPRTWAACHHLTCASDYVREGLISQGIPAEKILVNPYPTAAEEFQFVDRVGRTGPVTVGFIGGVNLRKGAPYFFEIARRLASPATRFVMVGPVALSAEGVSHKGPVELVGPVARSEVPGWLRQFDLFLFPSTCEGSAGVAAEAMATGLPLVTTPNSGTSLRPGQDGWIAPYDDLPRLTEHVARLIDDVDLRLRMGRSAWERSQELDLNAFATRLGELFRQLFTN